MENKGKRMIAVVGPTASGKTALSIELAKRLDGEIISADSMQIYKGMKIATAKPDMEEMQGIPHHLMDFLDPGTQFSVADYVELANDTAKDIFSRGKQPILCGGTGLYVRSFLENVRFTEEKSDPQLREQLNERYRTEGGEKMLEELKGFDPETAIRLHPSNSKRIVRAFEVYYLTGKTISQAVRESKQMPFPYEIAAVGLRFSDREKLYDRINKRVDIMLEKGLIEEAKEFYSMPIGRTAAAAIGYKELKPYLDGELTLEEAVEKLKAATRHYAKRQLTWFRRDEYIRWIDADMTDDIIAEALRILENN